MLTLTSPDFAPGTPLPARFTCEGANRSPAFRWAGVPERARELMLVCIDTDAPGGRFCHWVAYAIPPEWDFLHAGFGPETLEPGFRQGMNDFGTPGYGGPCPPRGDAPHSYHFRLSALSAPITAAAPGAGWPEIAALAAPHVMQTAEIVGLFARP